MRGKVQGSGHRPHPREAYGMRTWTPEVGAVGLFRSPASAGRASSRRSGKGFSPGGGPRAEQGQISCREVQCLPEGRGQAAGHLHLSLSARSGVSPGDWSRKYLRNR